MAAMAVRVGVSAIKSSAYMAPNHLPATSLARWHPMSLLLSSSSSDIVVLVLQYSSADSSKDDIYDIFVPQLLHGNRNSSSVHNLVLHVESSDNQLK